MRIRINTIMAHPRFGCAEPGTVLDLPDADARELIDAGAADAIAPHIVGPPARADIAHQAHETGRETAMLDDSEREREMMAPGRGRSSR